MTGQEVTTRDLGELSQGPREPVKMTFQWFGHTIRVADTAGDIPLIRFLSDAGRIDIGDEVGTALATHRFLEEQIHAEDWPKFLRIAQENRQINRDLLQVARNIVAAVAGFPTGRPSDSSDGPKHTSVNFNAGSLSVARQAMASVPNRPDLRRLIYQAQLARLQEERDQAAEPG